MSIHTLVNLPKDLGDCFLCIPALKKIISYCKENDVDLAFTGTARAHSWCEELCELELPLVQEKDNDIAAIINLNFHDESIVENYPYAAFFQPEKMTVYETDTKQFGKGAIVGKNRVTWLIEDCLRDAGILEEGKTLDIPSLPQSFVADEAVKNAVAQFGLSEKYAIIIPGCAPDKPMKMWPEEKFVALGKVLVEKGYQPVIIGGTAEQVFGKRLEKAIGGSAKSIVGQTSLSDIGALSKGAAFAIGNDTGPTHLAAAANHGRAFVFFGYYNDVKTWRPYNSCPINGTPKLQDIPVVRVVDIIEKAVEGKPAVITRHHDAMKHTP